MGYQGSEKITTGTLAVVFLLGNMSNKQEYICHLKKMFKNTCVPTSQMKKVFLYSFSLQLLEQPQTTTGDLSGGRLRCSMTSLNCRTALGK